MEDFEIYWNRIDCSETRFIALKMNIIDTIHSKSPIPNILDKKIQIMAELSV